MNAKSLKINISSLNQGKKYNIWKHGIQTKLGKNLFKLHSCFNGKKTVIIFLNVDHF